MTRVRLAASVAVVACALAVTGCDPGERQQADQPPAAASTASVSTPGAVPSGKPAVPERLTFTGKTVDGADFDAATLAGKPVVLWFWAPWCPKCRADAAAVARTAGQYSGKASVVGVAGLSTDAGSMRDFVTTTRTTGLTHLADPAGSVWKRFGVTSQHTYVLIAADGSVSYTGPLTAADLAARVGALVG